VEAPLTDADVAAFLARYERELSQPSDEAVVAMSRPLEVGFGFDIAAHKRAAARRALPAGAEVALEVLVRYRVDERVAALAAAVDDPEQLLPEARRRLMGVLVDVKRAQGEAWKAGQGKASADEVRAALATVLTSAAEAHRLLARLGDEVTAPPDAGAARDAIVLCPVACDPVSTRFSCSRCTWRGPSEATCFAPTAMRYIAATGERVGRELVTAPRALAP
jgi:hypothetical protein